jgi:hypothetical protein
LRKAVKCAQAVALISATSTMWRETYTVSDTGLSYRTGLSSKKITSSSSSLLVWKGVCRGLFGRGFVALRFMFEISTCLLLSMGHLSQNDVVVVVVAQNLVVMPQSFCCSVVDNSGFIHQFLTVFITYRVSDCSNQCNNQQQEPGLTV